MAIESGLFYVAVQSMDCLKISETNRIAPDIFIPVQYSFLYECTGIELPEIIQNAVPIMVTVYDLGFSGIFQYDCFQRAGAIQTGAGLGYLNENGSVLAEIQVQQRHI